WLVLDTATQQPLAGGSDGNEQLSVVRFSPATPFPVSNPTSTSQIPFAIPFPVSNPIPMSQIPFAIPLPIPNPTSYGSFLAIGSHDNFIYIYSVAEDGRKFTRFGRCV
ncbi:PREDICTED: echinoderm microtubule-associated protein-like 3, partial [Mesitornis unicolor]|uniref:echinoderm microtubule-associated protein-like 3 n=1 Tax=Mesitornis unicolor TaxID=54374 RepID=UPI0005290122